MKVTVDSSLCTGCGLCESSCPEVFKVDDSGIAKVVGDCSSCNCDIKEVAESCPVEAIKVK